MRTFSIYVKTLSTSTLMQMKKAELVEYVRMCEKNMADAYATLDQQAVNFKKLLDEKTTADSGPDTNVGTNQWIPCSEKLPKEQGYYLVTYDFGGGERVIGKSFYSELYDRFTTGVKSAITAWMPLPEPYKGVE